jgi:hypothetical protein
MGMMETSVRDPAAEERLYTLLNEDANKIWSVSSLVRQMGLPRLRVERAILVLQVQNKVVIEKPIGNTWVVRLPPNGKKGKGV